MLSRIVLGVCVFSLVIAPAQAGRRLPTTVYGKPQPASFASEAAAQAHCPRDTVVWLNTNSGIYHEKGMR